LLLIAAVIQEKRFKSISQLPCKYLYTPPYYRIYIEHILEHILDNI